MTKCDFLSFFVRRQNVSGLFVRRQNVSGLFVCSQNAPGAVLTGFALYKFSGSCYFDDYDDDDDDGDDDDLIRASP